MTSAGGTRAIPNYGPVSAAKAILEAHIRQLAVELAPAGITANAILAGVTDTPALRLVVGSIANIIVLDQARRLGVEIGWRRHARVGVPVTIATLALAWVWLLLRG